MLDANELVEEVLSAVGWVGLTGGRSDVGLVEVEAQGARVDEEGGFVL